MEEEAKKKVALPNATVNQSIEGPITDEQPSTPTPVTEVKSKKDKKKD